MKNLRSHTLRVARRAWGWFREVTGDAAYDNYLRSMQRAAAYASPAPAATQRHSEPLSRADFYLDALRRRYSSVSRCC